MTNVKEISCLILHDIIIFSFAKTAFKTFCLPKQKIWISIVKTVVSGTSFMFWALRWIYHSNTFHMYLHQYQAYNGSLPGSSVGTSILHSDNALEHVNESMITVYMYLHWYLACLY